MSKKIIVSVICFILGLLVINANPGHASPPHLILNKISINPTENILKTGDKVNIGVEVENTSDTNMTKDYDIYLYVDDQLLSQILHGQLDARRKRTEWAPQVWTAAPGQHIIKARLDIADTNYEVEIENPIITKTIMLQGSDLGIASEDIKFKPDPPKVDEEAEILIKVHNFGDKEAPAGSFDLVIYQEVNNTWKKIDRLRQNDPVSANGILTFVKKWTPKAAESYKFMAEIEISATRPEVDVEAGNNRAIASAKTAEGGTGLQFSKGDLKVLGTRTEGNTLTIVGGLYNKGTQISPSDTKVLVYIDNKEIGEYPLGSIAPQKSKSFHFEWECTAGTHPIKLAAKPGDSEHQLSIEVGEVKESDKMVTFTENDIELKEIKNFEGAILSLQIQAKIQNLLDRKLDKGSYLIEVSIDPGKTGYVNLGRYDGPEIAANGTVLFPVSPIQWPPATGIHEILFHVRPKIGHQGEFYVKKRFSIAKVPSLLSIASLVVQPTKVPLEEDVLVTVIIRNMGTRLSPRGNLQIRREGTTSYVAWASIPQIESQAVTTVRTNINTALLKVGQNKLELILSSGKDTSPTMQTFQLEVLKKSTVYTMTQADLNGLLEIAKKRKTAWEETREVYQAFRGSMDRNKVLSGLGQNMENFKIEALNKFVEEVSETPLGWITK
ncbi:MAG: hypothetical protein KKF07_04095, partial [Candidatus Margulisbacteria bacterium]|nr:hypothetical protein [Candidatus Margulisiibacteriota bacterium]